MKVWIGHQHQQGGKPRIESNFQDTFGLVTEGKVAYVVAFGHKDIADTVRVMSHEDVSFDGFFAGL